VTEAARTRVGTAFALAIVIAFAAACGTDATALEAFGETAIEVRSVHEIDVGPLNDEAQSAFAEGETWPLTALPFALRIAGEAIVAPTRTIMIDASPTERLDHAVITIAQRGFLDDSVAGDRYRLWFERGEDGVWVLTRGLTAQLCARPGNEFYSADPCP